MNKKVINKKIKKAQKLLKLNIKHKICPYCGEIIEKNEKIKKFYCEFCNVVF